MACCLFRAYRRINNKLCVISIKKCALLLCGYILGRQVWSSPSAMRYLCTIHDIYRDSDTEIYIFIILAHLTCCLAAIAYRHYSP